MKTQETIYKSSKFQIGKTIWSLVQASGKSNYVAIRKETSNPFKTLGKEFANFDEAIKNYKNPQMKLEILKIEMDLL